MTKNKRIILTILALFGLAVTIELIQIYFKVNFNSTFNPSFCSINGFIDCDGVAQTPYSIFLGVPLAIWGLILYSIVLFLTYVDKINEKLNIKLLQVFKEPACYISTLGLISFLISMSLASISIFTIKKICILCFVTYFLDLIISLTAKEKGFYVKEIKTTVLDFLDGAKNYFILFLVVCASVGGLLIWLQTSLVLSPNLRLQKSFDEFRKLDKNIYAIKGNTLGNPEGDIIVYLYSDFLCPYCKVTNTMLHKLAREQKDIVVYHMNFPLDSKCNPLIKQPIHPGSCLLAKYALAAEKQGAYWDMASAIYDNMPNTEEKVADLANEIGIDRAQLIKDANSKEIENTLNKQIQLAIDMNIKGTPTIKIDGIEHPSALPYYKLETYVKQARARHKAGNI